MFASATSRTPTESPCWRPLALVAAGIVLAGCATRPSVPLPDITPWDARQALLADLETWAFNGRIAVRTDDDGFNGKLRYRQAAGDFDAVVSGPLGVGTVMLERRGEVLAFTDRDGVTTEFTDPEIELKYRFGWDVPLDSLRYWALGIPDPSRPAETEFDDSGRLASMAQDGWDIAVTRYGETGGQSMPERLTVANAATRVTLVIDRWDFSESF